jgi:hypothetical protein
MFGMLTYVKIGLAAAVLAAVAAAGIHYMALRSERDGLLVETQAQAATIVSLEQKALDDKAANEAAVAAMQAAYDRAKASGKLKEEIASAPESDDGPVAPVLCRVVKCVHEDSDAGRAATP